MRAFVTHIEFCVWVEPAKKRSREVDSKLSGPRLQWVLVAFWMIAGCNQRESLGSKVMIIKYRLIPGLSILRFHSGLVDELTTSWDNKCLSGKLDGFKLFLSFGTLGGVSSKYGLLPTPARRLQWFSKNPPLYHCHCSHLLEVFLVITVRISFNPVRSFFRICSRSPFK